MIRLLTPADAPAYVALRRQMLQDAPWAFTAAPEDDRGSDVELVAASLAGPGYAIVGAFDDAQRALQSVAVLIREKSPKRAHLAWIVSVFTHPRARRRGLARNVMLRTIETARSWPGLAGVLLSVSENAAEAHTLYRSLGFVSWGVEPDAIRVAEHSFAEIHMRLEIAARIRPIEPSR